MFTFDFRGHGQSSLGGRYRPLQWPTNKELEDVLGACAYVENQLLADGRTPEIGLFGVSRGAGAALLAAASNPNVKAVICDGVFSTRTTLIWLMKRWAYIFARVKLVYENHPDWVLAHPALADHPFCPAQARLHLPLGAPRACAI